jgi:tetratricopeptide (TPR) repeat protein
MHLSELEGKSHTIILALSILSVLFVMFAPLAGAFANNTGAVALSNAFIRGSSQQSVEAAVGFQRATGWDPRNSRPYHGLGRVYLTQGNPERAAEMFAQEVQLSGGDRMAYLYLAKAYQAMGRDRETILTMGKAGVPGYFSHLMYQYYNRGEKERAEEIFHLALDLGLDAYTAYFQLGTLYASDGRWNEAEEPLRRALELKPNSAWAHFWWSLFLATTRGVDQAIPALLMAIDLSPATKEFHLTLGEFYQRRGEIELARAAYEKALALDPGYDHARTKLNELANMQPK